MKHIQTYEGRVVNNKKLVPKYKAGDYVMLDDYIARGILKCSKYARIINIGDQFSNQFYYKIETSDNKSIPVGEYVIKDMMTDKQIKKYSLEFTANKYNL